MISEVFFYANSNLIVTLDWLCPCRASEQQQQRGGGGGGAVRVRALAMLTLASKLKRDDGGKTGRVPGTSDSTHRVSIRDRLLTKGTRVKPPVVIELLEPESSSGTYCIHT